MASAENSTATLGDRIWDIFTSDTHAKQHQDFSHLLNIQTLDGHGGSSCKVYTANKVAKGSYLCISMGPVARYINIHLIPEHIYDVPRLVFEGMVTAQGGQLSVDLYPDKDIIPEFEQYLAQYDELLPCYNEARANKNIAWESSRTPHMRAFFSPFSLLAYDITPDNQLTFESYAEAYLRHWLKMLHEAEPAHSDVAEERLKRRAKMKQVLIDNDPDRPKVVSIFGEEITSGMEQATML